MLFRIRYYIWTDIIYLVQTDVPNCLSKIYPFKQVDVRKRPTCIHITEQILPRRSEYSPFFSLDLMYQDGCTYIGRTYIATCICTKVVLPLNSILLCFVVPGQNDQSEKTYTLRLL